MGKTSEFAINAGPILLGLGLIWYIINTIRSYLRLRQFKGPTIAGFSNIWVFSSTLRGELNERTAEILKEHGGFLSFIAVRVERSSLTRILCVGPLSRIGPNILVTNDADLLRHMSGARSTYSRAAWYDGMRLDPRVNNVISERNDKRHNALRAKMASGVSLTTSTFIAFHADLWTKSTPAKKIQDWNSLWTTDAKIWWASSERNMFPPRPFYASLISHRYRNTLPWMFSLM